MIKVEPFPHITSYYTGKNHCDICGKPINLDLPFSRGMKVSYEAYYLSKKRKYDRALYTHAGACETMAVLELSYEHNGN